MAHEKTDTFRERVEYSNQLKGTLGRRAPSGRGRRPKHPARSGRRIADVESGVAIDLFLSYRAVSAWQDMVSLVDKMAPPLQETVLVREQLGLALNRLNLHDEAEAVLTKLIEERGPAARPRHPGTGLQGSLGGGE